MKPYLFKKIFFLTFLFFLLTPFLAGAIKFENPLVGITFEELIDAITDFIFWVTIAIAPIMIIVAAFYFLTSGGNPEKVSKAKKIILFTIIGLIIILLGKGIVAIIGQIIWGGQPPPGCNDPDGNNRLIQGTCTDTLACAAGCTDECIDATNIKEYTCNLIGNTCTSSDSKCPTGTSCVAGACVGGTCNKSYFEIECESRAGCFTCKLGDDYKDCCNPGENCVFVGPGDKACQ